MTYDPIDSNDDGTVDADVDNENTTTQTLDAGYQTITNIVAKAAPTSNQTISSGTVTQVNLDTAVVEDDASNIVEVDTANNKLIIKSDGKYLISQLIHFNSSTGFSAGDTISSRLLLDGSNEVIFDRGHTGGNVNSAVGPISTIIDSTSGTEITLQAFQNTGENQSVLGSKSRTYIAVYKLG